MRDSEGYANSVTCNALGGEMCSRALQVMSIIVIRLCGRRTDARGNPFSRV